MSLNGNQRAQLVYNRAAAQPAFANMSQAEKDAFLGQLKNIFTDDTAYLTQNAVVLPAGMSVPAPIPVQVAILSGTGATTAPGGVAGTGTIS
ncbi:MAG: hypothetical protein EOP64_00330 [Sphingomonas sp.]|nr:MAG: hypothetical protein EOP64_00330 [Sphingomonas sp.]